MCPMPPTPALQSIASSIEVPKELQDTIANAPQHHLSIQHLVSQTHSGVPVPPSGHGKFACKIFDLHNSDTPGNTGDKVVDTTDKAFIVKGVDEARDKCLHGLHTSWKFYNSVLSRNSLDGNGLELIASIHMDKNLGDAHWDPNTQQMFFGDGGVYGQDLEGKLLSTSLFATYGIDVIGHELTHGVVANTAALRPVSSGAEMPDLNLLKDWASVSEDTKKELAQVPLPFEHRQVLNGLLSQKSPVALTFLTKAPGAEAQTLNEHIADCFGIMIKHFGAIPQQTAESGNWQIAPGFWSEQTMKDKKWSTDCNYLRTFEKPKSGSSVPESDGPKVWDANTKFYLATDVHRYAGIGNHAFYQAALKFGGFTWNSVGKIWYNALKDDKFKDYKNQTFKGWRDLTIEHARLLNGGDWEKKMIEAWKSVNL